MCVCMCEGCVVWDILYTPPYFLLLLFHDDGADVLMDDGYTRNDSLFWLLTTHVCVCTRIRYLFRLGTEGGRRRIGRARQRGIKRKGWEGKGEFGRRALEKAQFLFSVLSISPIYSFGKIQLLGVFTIALCLALTWCVKNSGSWATQD